MVKYRDREILRQRAMGVSVRNIAFSIVSGMLV